MLEALNLEKISILDKFLMMEEIWKDLSEHSTAMDFRLNGIMMYSAKERKKLQMEK